MVAIEKITVVGTIKLTWILVMDIVRKAYGSSAVSLVGFLLTEIGLDWNSLSIREKLISIADVPYDKEEIELFSGLRNKEWKIVNIQYVEGTLEFGLQEIPAYIPKKAVLSPCENTFYSRELFDNGRAEPIFGVAFKDDK